MDVPENQHDPQFFLASARLQIHLKRVEEILSLNGVKFQLLLEVRLYRQTPEGVDQWNEPTCRSKMDPLQLMRSQMRWTKDPTYPGNFTNEGSRWTVTVSHAEVKWIPYS